MRRPNIILLLADQHRGDALGCMGNPEVDSPNLDALAADGVLFRRTYCQGPLCVPARVSLLTERYVRDHGASENGYPPDPDLPTIVQAVSAADYHTAAIGKLHFFAHAKEIDEAIPRMRALGFDEVHEEVGKIESASADSAYTRYLERRGTLEAYQRFVLDRSTAGRAAAAAAGRPSRERSWSADPSPLPGADFIDTYIGSRIVDWLAARKSTQPFFLWAGFAGPHSPYDTPAEYGDRYAKREISLSNDSTRRPELHDGPLVPFLRTFLERSDTDTLTDERIRAVRRQYYANVTLIDEQIGAIVAQLERSGLADNTWLVYSADHGEMLGTHGLLQKEVFYEPSVNVPLIVRPPGGGPGVVTDDLVEHVDVSATIRHIAGAADLPDGAGRSLLPFTNTPAQRTGREVVISENYGFGMFRTDRYKLVVYERTGQPVQLFDLKADPIEDHNLVEDPRHAEVRQDLLARYARPFLRTSPRRTGPDIVERAAAASGMPDA